MLPRRYKAFLRQVLTNLAAMAESPEKHIKLLIVYINKLNCGCAVSRSQPGSKRITPLLRLVGRVRILHTAPKASLLTYKMHKTGLLFRKFCIFPLFSGYFAPKRALYPNFDFTAMPQKCWHEQLPEKYLFDLWLNRLFFAQKGIN
jgi:hypothetical protein